MRKASLRPTTSYTAGSSVSSGAGESSRRLSRKISSAYTSGGVGRALSTKRESTLIDEGVLEGKIKVSSTIKNSDVCLSVDFRADGRFYSVALANGLVNVYNSRTDNILYTLNKDEKDLPFTDVSATCVRFRPFHTSQAEDEAGSLLSSQFRGRKDRRKSSGSGTASADSDFFLPPISSARSSSQQQYSQRRRKSSVSALGLRSIADELGLVPSVDKTLYNNIVTASFTDGSLKTFNFITEQCIREIKEDREILTMGYSKNGNVLATGGGNGFIHVYDQETPVSKTSYRPPFQYNTEYLRTYAIAFHPETDFEFFSGGWDKYIHFYDTRVPNLSVAKIEGPKICGEGIAFHSNGKEFCTAAWRKGQGIQLFDYAMRKPLWNIGGCPSKSDSVSESSKSYGSRKEQQMLPSPFLYSVRYFMNNFIVTCGSYPGSMAVVERNSGNVIACVKALKDSVYGVDAYKSKVALITRNEVSVSEIYL